MFLFTLESTVRDFSVTLFLVGRRGAQDPNEGI